MTRREPRLLRFHAGRNWATDDGWCATLAIVTRPDLMGPAEEGQYVLVGLEVHVQMRWPWHHICGHALAALNGDRTRWRWPVRLWIRSDAREIATRAGRFAGLSWRDLA